MICVIVGNKPILRGKPFGFKQHPRPLNLPQFHKLPEILRNQAGADG